jgi:hypothetical protein
MARCGVVAGGVVAKIPEPAVNAILGQGRIGKRDGERGYAVIRGCGEVGDGVAILDDGADITSITGAVWIVHG